jgi:hypothetical protein
MAFPIVKPCAASILSVGASSLNLNESRNDFADRTQERMRSDCLLEAQLPDVSSRGSGVEQTCTNARFSQREAAQMIK